MKNILMCNCAGKWGSVAPLVLRLAVGLVFAMHGWQKLQAGVDPIAGMLNGLGFPMPEVFAVILIAAELIGGILLILGLFTHWAAKILTVVAVVALVAVHLPNGFFLSSGGYEFILLILAVSVSLVITGAGKYSLDHSIFKK